MITYAGLDAAIIRTDSDGVVVYSYDKAVKILMTTNHWGLEEAIEWMEFNILGGHLGPLTPRWEE